MTKLKLSAIPNDKPVKITIELPATVHRDLVIYSEILANVSGETKPHDPAKLIPPMLQRFMTTDKGFAKAKRTRNERSTRPHSESQNLKTRA